MKIIAVTIALLSITLPSIAGAETINYPIETDGYKIITDQEFHRIHMGTPGYGVIESPGDPALPEKILELWVHQDIDWSSVRFTVEIINESEVIPNINIIPNPPLKPGLAANAFDFEYDPDYEDWGVEKSIVNGKNMYVYGRDANFPEQHVELLPYTERKIPIQTGPDIYAVQVTTPVDAFGENKYLRLAYRPFIYNPVSKELTLITKANIIITYDRYPINGIKSAGVTHDYVIITTNDIVSNSTKLDSFVYLKELQSHNVKVVTETDFGGLTGQAPNGRAEKIRKWLIDNYNTLEIDYVLLIGDPDPDDPTNPSDSVGDIPMKMCFPRYFSSTYRESPTDYFYADLTGNWDLDNDQYFGEDLDLSHIKSPDPLIGEDTFSANWTGKIMCDYNETYKFHTFSDDGVRLYIDGSLVIDNWAEHLPANDYWTQSMTAGKHDITLEFRENTADGIIQLFWQTTVPKGHANYVGHQIIPSDHLYDASDVVGGLSGTYYDNSDFTGTSITRKDAVINFIWGTGDQGAGGPDTGSEVFVGRIPVYNDDYAKLDDILQKIIEYETDPGDISWRKSILLPMKPMDENTPCAHLGEGIKNDLADPASFTSYRIYEEDYNPPTPELWPCNKNNVKNEWKNGYGMVVWATHGSQTSASDIFDSSLTTQLNDTKPAFTFQTSCLTGYPENDNNLAYALLKHGGIATVGASRVSWYSGGNWTTYDPNSGVYHPTAYYYTKGVISDGLPAGVALAQQKAPIPKMGMNEMDFNLYGDPDCYLLSTFPNSPPTADANGPYVADEGTAITFNASGSSDPEGDSLEYRWDLDNDGDWDTDWSNDPATSNTWGDDYSGEVKVEVRDMLGLTGVDITSVIVNNVEPTVSNISMDQPNPQFILPIVHTLTFNGSFIDPGWLDTHTSLWDFDDGTIVNGTLTEEHDEPNATGNTTAEQVYSEPGVYTVNLTITDDDGGVGTATMQVIVVDAEGAKHDLNDYIQNLPNNAFKKPADQRKNAFANKFNAIDEMFEADNYHGAINKLQNEVRPKADGYVDGNMNDDWIIDPVVQAEICMKIDDLTAYLETLL